MILIEQLCFYQYAKTVMFSCSLLMLWIIARTQSIKNEVVLSRLAVTGRQVHSLKWWGRLVCLSDPESNASRSFGDDDDDNDDDWRFTATFVHMVG